MVSYEVLYKRPAYMTSSFLGSLIDFFLHSSLALRLGIFDLIKGSKKTGSFSFEFADLGFELFDPVCLA
jgi:hypothetical protein